MSLKFENNFLELTINDNLKFSDDIHGRFIDEASGRYIVDNNGVLDIYDRTNKAIAKDIFIDFNQLNGQYTLCIGAEYNAIYGFGERFDSVNQVGLSPEIKVIEKFCYQGKVTYMPIPFCWTDTGLGLYLDTEVVSRFELKDGIKLTFEANSKGELPKIYLIFGEPKEIIDVYTVLTGRPKLPPKWAFGIWMSANRWNTQAETERQLRLCDENDFPVNAVVLEAWSDEATFYIWNDAQYDEKTGADSFSYSDFVFPEDGKWPNPKGMIDSIHEKGIKVILWQIPVLKKLEEGRVHQQHQKDCEHASDNNLCVGYKGGNAYTIPEGNWFSGSLIPDFTNHETNRWWFDKRKYLLDMGVDGFKTDGGEFIYKENMVFANGKTDKEMKNGYSSSYVKAYTEFIGEGRVLFSRAGYTGQQNYPIQWAGDQQSTWDEFKSVIKAGLSCSLSGVPFWSFDISGFAGPLPTPDLYMRSTQTAVFVPVMQWHSEPPHGQFKEIMPSAGGNNDRSPWNIADFYKDNDLLGRVRFHHNLRMNLIPYIYNQAIKSSNTGVPLMKHLTVEYPFDSNCLDIEDQFMLGDILVAPIMEEGRKGRKLYLPHDVWIDLWTGEVINGGQSIYRDTGVDRIPVFIREGCAIALNLDDSLRLGSKVGNSMDKYHNLCFYLTGLSGEYHFIDDLDNEFIIKWENGTVDINYIKGHIEIKTIFV